MSKNVGTLVTAAVRPNDNLDLISSAFATEIKGGLHTTTSTSDRDSIFEVRREWGMMCYVTDVNKTYQLTYGYNSGSTTITDNLNWKEFNGSSSGSSGEWVDSVLTVLVSEPSLPNNGDRYLVGLSGVSITGASWSYNTGGFIAEWNSGISTWDYTYPTNNMSVRVDDQDNIIYRYEGIYSSGQWEKEKESQIRYITATTSNNINYTSIVNPYINSYDIESIYITKFISTNIGASVSLNINGLGDRIIKKVSGLGLTDIISGELSTSYQYPLTYNGIYFELVIPSGGSSSLEIKYTLVTAEHIIVPSNTQYWVYGDLTIDASIIENYGRVIITNGSLNLLNSGQITGSGSVVMNAFAEIDGLGQKNYFPKWKSSYMLSGTSSITDTGSTVDITSVTFSVNSNFVYPKGASAGYTLVSDSNGYATWGKGYEKFSATQSFTGGVTYSISHGLNSPSIVFNFWDENTGKLTVVTATKTSDNTIDVNSSVTVANGRVVIIR